MPRSISDLVMQMMRVANAGGGACGRRRLLSLRLSMNMLFPFKAKWSLLAWMQASWRARICRLSCHFIGIATFFVLWKGM
jgi:hypothetical protein